MWKMETIVLTLSMILKLMTLAPILAADGKSIVDEMITSDDPLDKTLKEIALARKALDDIEAALKK